MIKLLQIFEDMTQDEKNQHMLNKTGFWGKRGAGVIVIASSTGRILLQYRSIHIEQPHTWGNSGGGAIDDGENPKDAAIREFHEESGYSGKLQIIPINVFKHSSGFRYYNFIGIVEDEFNPIMDRFETEGFKWCELSNLPSPLHFGVKYVFNDPKAIKILKKYQKN